MNRFAIAGLGVTSFGQFPHLSINALAAEAVCRAIEDAGLTRQQIDGFISKGPGMGSEGQVPRFLGLGTKFIWAIGTGGVSAHASITAACGALDAGMADYVVCLEAMDRARTPPVGSSTSAVAQELSHIYGHIGPSGEHAYAARRHMHEYGTTSRQLGAVAVATRWYANQRPDALMHAHALTIEEHQQSPYVVEPLRLLDCCLQSDGAVAVIVTTIERARALKSKPVAILGIGMGHQVRQYYLNRSCVVEDVAPAKEAAFRGAGIELKDIDVAQICDAYSFTVITQMEGYGWCGPGEGGPFVESGATRMDGIIPVNTAGGALSGWYCEGYTFIAEAVRQLRNQGGATQVKDARIALATGHGSTGTGRGMQYIHGAMVLGKL